MSVKEKTLIGKIDLTPTWQGIVPALILLIENGNAEGRKFAQEELMRLAAFADSQKEKANVKEKV